MSQLIEVKRKNTPNLLNIEGVHAVGLRVREEKIVVYVKEITNEILLMVPQELEGFLVDICIQEPPESHVYHPSNGILSENYYRPVPGGVSVGQANISAGTMGSWWKSKYYNKTIGVSNNHIIGDQNHGKIRRKVSSTFKVLSGGVPFIPVLADKGLTQADYIFDIEGEKNRCEITSITPSMGKAGDIITIVGKSLGARWGYSKIYIDGIEAPVKSWTFTGIPFSTINNLTYTSVVSTIECYVPLEARIGTVDITLDLEGDPIVSPGMYDSTGLPFPQNVIGEALDYLPISNNSSNLGDIGIFTVHDESVIDQKTYSRAASSRHLSGWDDRFYMNRTNIFPNLSYKPSGFLMEPYEFLAVIKTGRTTGTTVNFILDTHYTSRVNYGTDSDPFLGIFDETILCGKYFDKDGNDLGDGTINHPYYLRYSDGGDSGSSVFTCPPELFEQFYDYYGIAKPPKIYFEPAYLFVGNNFAGGGSGSIHDIYGLWSEVPQLQLETLDQNVVAGGFITSGGSLQMEVWKGKLVSGNATVSTNFNLVIYPTIWMVKDKATGTSRTEINIFQYQTISVGTTSLVPYLIPTDNRQLDFLLTSLNSGTGTLEIRANGVSTTSGSERIVIYLSQLSLSLSGASTTSGSERIVIYLSQLGLSLMGASTTNGDAQISIFVPLPQLLLSDILATSDSNGNALFNLYPVGWKPSLQYEELYFTITRTKDLYFSV